MQVIDRHIILDIVHAVGGSSDSADGFARAVRATAQRHGEDIARRNPWDYTGSEMAHAIAEYFSVSLAHDYLRVYGTAHANAV